MLVDEFAQHGVQVNRVVLGGEPGLLSEPALAEVRRVCAERALDFQFVPELFGVRATDRTQTAAPAETDATVPAVALPSYFCYKRVIGFAVSLPLIIALTPVMIFATLAATIDVGQPVFFWQQRIGLNCRRFLLYKLCTMRPPFDLHGRRIPEEERLSAIGRILRKTRLDELPQVLNVLVGDMSLIGPRPLLPRDQAPAAAIRLMVPPGITGWAQVNGGKLLSPTEKALLDEWYIRNASAWLDLRIALLTLLCLVRGDRRSDLALERARRMLLRNRGTAAPVRMPPVSGARLNGERLS